jgi:hypothetical protein
VRAYPRKKIPNLFFAIVELRESKKENPKRQKLNNPCYEGHHHQTEPSLTASRLLLPVAVALTSLGHAMPIIGAGQT